MVNTVSIQERPQTTATETLRPFTGKLPCSGEGELCILPEEKKAVDALIMAYQKFSDLAQTIKPGADDIILQFETGINKAHLAIGTLYFLHTLNQEYRKLGGTPEEKTLSKTPIPTITTQETLVTLKHWRNDFLKETAERHYSEAFQDILLDLLDAWDHTLSLTHCYPDQHLYHEFIQGIKQCETILNQLRQES